MTKEDFEQLKSTVKQWLFHTGSLDPTNYANELKIKFIEPLEKELEFEKSVNGEFTAIEKLRELEKENAELKDTLEGYKKIAKWCDKCDKIANLEKENAELKEDRNSLQELVTYYQTNFCQEYNNS